MIPFFKYQGTGNDFVLIDQRQKQWVAREDRDLVARMCDRRFGIGADGLMLLQSTPGYDFEMVYFNADGGESSMCGNGGRCIAAFANRLKVIGKTGRFIAIDGPHDVHIPRAAWVELKMGDVEQVQVTTESTVLNTGSPHYVRFVENAFAVPVFEEGRAVRYNETYQKEGINVNFASGDTGGLLVSTYERGVEAETLSCGTGVTACAIATYIKQSGVHAEKADVSIPIRTKGGQLEVRFSASGGQFRNIWLCGPATYVFKGQFKI